MQAILSHFHIFHPCCFRNFAHLFFYFSFGFSYLFLWMLYVICSHWPCPMNVSVMIFLMWILVFGYILHKWLNGSLEVVVPWNWLEFALSNILQSCRAQSCPDIGSNSFYREFILHSRFLSHSKKIAPIMRTVFCALQILRPFGSANCNHCRAMNTSRLSLVHISSKYSNTNIRTTNIYTR